MKRWLFAMVSLAMVVACSTGDPTGTTTGAAPTTAATSAAYDRCGDLLADDFGAGHDGGGDRLSR